MRPYLLSVLLGVFLAIPACSSSDSKPTDSKKDSGDDDDDSSGDDDDSVSGDDDDDDEAPALDAKDLGADCSGFGTGIGQTALFDDEDCASKYCLADARKDLTLYCSADCTTAKCPTGYECKAVDNGDAERACFKKE